MVGVGDQPGPATAVYNGLQELKRRRTRLDEVHEILLQQGEVKIQLTAPEIHAVPVELSLLAAKACNQVVAGSVGIHAVFLAIDDRYMVQPEMVVEIEVEQRTIHIQQDGVYTLPVNQLLHGDHHIVVRVGSMAKLPEILKKTVVAQSRFFTIEGLHLRFGNGAERHYERLRTAGTGAVMIVPLLDADTVLMIREYGAGVEAYTLGLPKGALDADETVQQGAHRELQEEVGYGAGLLTPLKELTLSPGYMGSRLQVVLAEELYPSRLEGDEPEAIEVVPMKLSELDDWVWREELSEARSIAALYLVRDMLRARHADAVVQDRHHEA